MRILRTLIAATKPEVKARAQNSCYGKSRAIPRGKVRSANGTGYLDQDGTGDFVEFNYEIRCSTGWRKTMCRFYGPIGLNTKVYVWCSCEYFKYNSEVSLARDGTSSVVNSNGERPRFTNPKMDARVCKHAVLLFATAMKNRTPDDKELGKKTDTNGLPPKKKTEQQQVGRIAPEPVKLPALPVSLPPLPSRK